MADYFDDTIDDTLDYDDDGWFYIEEADDYVEDLVESVIPDPGYAGVNDQISMTTYEYDPYAYFDDLEYGDDTYYDTTALFADGDGAAGGNSSRTSLKRKRGLVDGGEGRPSKHHSLRPRGTVASVQWEDGVEFVPISQRCRLHRKLPALKHSSSFSLLPDWRVRFANTVTPQKRAMPLDMRKAAEAPDEYSPSESTSPLPHTGESKSAEDLEDLEEKHEEVESNDTEGDTSPNNSSASLDPEMLRAILQQRLKEAGLHEMDEAAFMASLQGMLSGSSDDAASALAEKLLGQVDGGNDALSGWLTGQGVSLDEAADDQTAVKDADANSQEGSSTAMDDDAPTFQTAKVVSNGSIASPQRRNNDHRATSPSANVSSTVLPAFNGKALPTTVSRKRKAEPGTDAEQILKKGKMGSPLAVYSTNSRSRGRK